MTGSIDYCRITKLQPKLNFMKTILQLLILLILLSVSTLVVIKCTPNSIVLQQQEQKKEAKSASEDETLSDVPKTETLIALENSTQAQKAISFNNVQQKYLYELNQQLLG